MELGLCRTLKGLLLPLTEPRFISLLPVLRVYARVSYEDWSITDAEGTVHTSEGLQPYFSKVANPKHWKNPIDAIVYPADLYPCLAAIEFFTGSTDIRFKDVGGVFRVQAEGYFEAIGA